MSSSLKNIVRLVGILTLMTMVACGSTVTENTANRPVIQSTTESIDGLLTAARSSTGLTAATYSILAIEEMIKAEQYTSASTEAAQISNSEQLPADLQIRFAIANAELAMIQQQPQSALDWLTADLVSGLTEQSANYGQYYYLLGNAYRDTDQALAAIGAYIVADESDAAGAEFNSVDEIWAALMQLSEPRLDEFARTADNYESRGWIELARVFKSDQYSIKMQLNGIDQWRRIWASHSAANRLPSSLLNLEQVWQARPRHIALILPIQEAPGNAIQEGFFSAYYQALAVSREVPRVSVYDSSYISNINTLYDTAVASGADLIIGPLYKPLVNQLQQRNELAVTTLALNYGDESQIDSTKLFQFGLAPQDEIEQAIELAWEAGHRNAAIITPRSDDYRRLQEIFAERWSSKGGLLVSESTFSGDSDYADMIKRLMAIDSSEARAQSLLTLLPRNNMEFTPRTRDDIDFIFLMANPRQGRQIKPTLSFYFAENIPVYAMPSIYDGQENQSENRDLDGIIFTDAPWLLRSSDPLKNDISSNLRQAQGPLQRLRAMGVDSFRLYPRLHQLEQGQIEELQGTTGILSLSTNRRIHRTLDVARFIDGKATETTSSP